MPLLSTHWLRRFVRFLFRYPGLRVPAHAVRRFAYRDEWVLIDDFDGDLRFHCNLGEHIGSQMYWRDSYSWAELKVLEPFLTEEAIFFDVGANQGEFALFAAKRLKKGLVFAFEPMAAMLERLERNVRENGFQNVRLVNAGLWSERVTKPIFTPGSEFPDGSRNEGLGTLFQTATCSFSPEQIRLTPLDDFMRENEIDRLDVFKMDVEGAELGVLQGGRETFDRFRPVVLLEVNRECLEAAGHSTGELMAALGRWYRFELVRRSGRSVPLTVDRVGDYQNILCLPK